MTVVTAAIVGTNITDLPAALFLVPAVWIIFVVVVVSGFSSWRVAASVESRSGRGNGKGFRLMAPPTALAEVAEGEWEDKTLATTPYDVTLPEGIFLTNA